MMKSCINCCAEKPLPDFPKRKDSKDGCRNTCNKCTNSDWKKYKENNRESCLENTRRYARTEGGKAKAKAWRLSDKGREAKLSYQREYRLNNPEKNKAHYLLQSAVSAGEVIKPDNCSKCGDSGSIHGHHPDYSKPLRVEWLCAGCHITLHKEDA